MLVPQIVGVPAPSAPLIENWSSTQSPIKGPKIVKQQFNFLENYNHFH